MSFCGSSYSLSMLGTLFVVATPIGNLGDISIRALDTLRQVSMIACEDTRRTQQLMNHYQIKNKLIRYDEHSHKRMSPQILESVGAGQSVALVTDAGTPGVSDPGSRLIQEAIKKRISVVPIPGASSLISALSVSGFGSESFVFLGFLPRRTGRAKRMLREALGLGRTTIVFESPFRIMATLATIEDVCSKADVLLAREMTKMYEEFIRGDIQTVRSMMEKKTPKGEFVLIVEPKID
ncbi:16S rRNA (cytidine(1402)-2'-O)-methyltransferase [bacterium F11]|nr:16S rRNA (cytidine(1402)-2'-O)-methyltransferase [bacterium F11]